MALTRRGVSWSSTPVHRRRRDGRAVTAPSLAVTPVTAVRVALPPGAILGTAGRAACGSFQG